MRCLCEDARQSRWKNGERKRVCARRHHHPSTAHHHHHHHHLARHQELRPARPSQLAAVIRESDSRLVSILSSTFFFLSWASTSFSFSFFIHFTDTHHGRLSDASARSEPRTQFRSSSSSALSSNAPKRALYPAPSLALLLAIDPRSLGRWRTSHVRPSKSLQASCEKLEMGCGRECHLVESSRRSGLDREWVRRSCWMLGRTGGWK